MWIKRDWTGRTSEKIHDHLANWSSLTPRSWHRFVSWGLGGFVHQIPEKDIILGAHNTWLGAHYKIRVKWIRTRDSQGTDKPPSPKPYPQEYFMTIRDIQIWVIFPRLCWVPWAAGNIGQDSGDETEEGGPVQRREAEFGDLGTKVWEQTEGNFDGDCKWCQT